MKIDLHVHTCHSKRPAIWLLQKLGCPESFTDPLLCYRELKRRGMGGVTFTDHNSIEGCLAVAHLPDTFISEEITAYFPEDRCKVHVLAYRITEDDHAVIQKKRDNLYDLVGFLREHGIVHAIAHPFSAVNDKFERKHFEKLLLLFNNFEINGDQIGSVNQMLRRILDTLTPEEIRALSLRHGIAEYGERPWRKRLVSGSDDHAGIRFADSYTEVPRAKTAAEFFLSLERGDAAISTTPATELSFGRDIYAVAYRYGKKRFGVERFSGADVLLRFCDAVLQPRFPREYGLISRIGYAVSSFRQPKCSDAEASLTGFVRGQASRLIQRTPELLAILETPVDSGGSVGVWFDFVDRIANMTTADLAGTFLKRLRAGRYFDLFHLLGSAGSLYMLLAPYLIAFSFCAAEKRLAKRIAEGLRPESADRRLKVACLSDTFHEDNAVANSLRPQLARALRTKRHLRVLIASEKGAGKESAQPGVRAFAPAASWDISENPGLRLNFPAVLPLLRHVCEEDYTCLMAATAGPVGLSALLAGRLLGLPVATAYNPALFEYLQGITEDRSVTEVMWWYVVWFCNQCDLVQAGSAAELEELAARGVSRDRLRVCAGGEEQSFAFETRWLQLHEMTENARRNRRETDMLPNTDAERNAPESPDATGGRRGMEDAAPDWLRQAACLF